jgi:putative phage-type endonuclease
VQQLEIIEQPKRFITRGFKPVRIPFDSEAEWLEQRMHAIGGSDIGSVVGFNGYRTALDVYLEKIGLVQPPDLSKNNAVRMGKKLEPIVIEVYEEDAGEKVHRVHAILQHPEHTWMRCSLDGRVVGKPWIVEAKTVGVWAQRNGQWGDAESDAVPLSYLAQTQWGMSIADAERCAVPVLVGGQEPRIYYVERDDALIELLAERGHEFWQRVLMAIPLVNEYHDLVSRGWASLGEKIMAIHGEIMRIAPAAQTEDDAFKKWHMQVDGKQIEASDEIYAMDRELRDVDAARKAAEERSDQLKTALKDYMQDAETLVYGREPIRTWKHQTATLLDGGRLKVEKPDVWDEYSYENPSRVMRAKNPPKPKGKKAA